MPIFVVVLYALFTSSVVAVQDDEETVRFLCSEDVFLYAISELQKECDSR